MLQGKVGINHCSQRYRGLPRVRTESTSTEEGNEKFP